MTSKTMTTGKHTIVSDFGVTGQLPNAQGLKTYNVTRAISSRRAVVGACLAADERSARDYFARVEPETTVLAVELAGVCA